MKEYIGITATLIIVSAISKWPILLIVRNIGIGKICHKLTDNSACAL